ncbi:unnamed protein product [Cochlearia groenlandica]
MKPTFEFTPPSSFLKRKPYATFLRRRRIYSTVGFSLIAVSVLRYGSMEKASGCEVCHALNRASICVACVNLRLNEYKVKLDSLKNRKEISYLRLSGLLVTKEKVISQHCWIELRDEKLARLQGKLKLGMEKLQQSMNILILKKFTSLELPSSYGLLICTTL